MRQIAGKGSSYVMQREQNDLTKTRREVIIDIEKVLPVDGQPRWVKRENPPNLSGPGGLSYAFRTTRINSVTKSNASKSLIVIGIAPL